MHALTSVTYTLYINNDDIMLNQFIYSYSSYAIYLHFVHRYKFDATLFSSIPIYVMQYIYILFTGKNVKQFMASFVMIRY